MKNSKTYTKLIVFSSLCLLSQMAFAQDEYEKRQKTNKENEEHLNRVYENNLPNKKTSNINIAPTTSSSSGSSIYVTDHQKKMDYYNNKEKARLDAWEEKERKFQALSADVPKTEANYHRLIALAEQAGFDYYDAMRMNGRYAPKVVTLPVLVPYKQEQFDNYKKLAEDYREKKDWNNALNAFLEAVKISDDPNLREQIAYIYQNYLYDYDNEAMQYYLIQQSAITNKPDMKYVYENWGKVSILRGDYKNAISCFTDLPTRSYDGTVSIYQSYAYFLTGNTTKALASLLDRYTYDNYNDISNLIKNYYLIQQGNNDAAAALLLKNKEKETDYIPYTGDVKKDLSLIFLKRAKTSNFERNLADCYFLDLAEDLDPSNMDIIETRYDYNTKLKRVGFDAGMSPELLLKLAEGKPARAILKEKMRNKGYMILWFGNGDKPLVYAGFKVNMAVDMNEQKAINHLLEEAKTKETFKKYNYISNTFIKDASEDDVYNEVAKKLKINLKKAKEYKYGYLSSSYTYKFEK